MASTLRAGAARVELPAEPGWPMMGYGARREPARARHDALYARALCVERGADTVLLVECDLCLLGVAQCDEVRERVAATTGLARDAICVACIHTHSGPETGLAERALGKPSPAWEAPLLEAIVRAGCEAHAALEPARLGVGLTRAAIGRNRRRLDAPVDERVAVVRVDRVAGDPLAILYVHGCHPTALGHDNLAYSADWPGFASAAVERAFPGALAIFALGAHGDVDPRTRGLQDLTLPDQSRGVGLDEVAALGEELAQAVVACAAALAPSADVTVGAHSRRVPLAVHGGDDRERVVAQRRRAAAETLGLTSEPPRRASDWYRLEHERTAHLPRDAQREAIARVRLYLRDLQAPTFAGGERVEAEVQQLRLGALALWAVPFEVTADVGRALAERAGSASVMPLSIANGWLRYLPHPDHFALEHAHQQYEVLGSVFPADTAARLLPL